MDSSLKIHQHGQVFVIKLNVKTLLLPNYNVSNFVLTHFRKRFFACEKFYFYFIWPAFCSPSHLHFVVISKLRLNSRKLIPNLIWGCFALQFSIYVFLFLSQYFDLFWFFSPAFCSPHWKKGLIFKLIYFRIFHMNRKGHLSCIEIGTWT